METLQRGGHRNSLLGPAHWLVFYNHSGQVCPGRPPPRPPPALSPTARVAVLGGGLSLPPHSAARGEPCAARRPGAGGPWLLTVWPGGGPDRGLKPLSAQPRRVPAGETPRPGAGRVWGEELRGFRAGRCWLAWLPGRGTRSGSERKEGRFGGPTPRPPDSPQPPQEKCVNCSRRFRCTQGFQLEVRTGA